MSLFYKDFGNLTVKGRNDEDTKMSDQMFLKLNSKMTLRT